MSIDLDCALVIDMPAGTREDMFHFQVAGKQTGWVHGAGGPGSSWLSRKLHKGHRHQKPGRCHHCKGKQGLYIRVIYVYNQSLNVIEV